MHTHALRHKPLVEEFNHFVAKRFPAIDEKIQNLEMTRKNSRNVAMAASRQTPRETRTNWKRDLIRFLGFLLPILWLATRAEADENVVRGEAVIEKWCRFCHPRASDAADPAMAPTFEEIVRREGRDRAYFIRFLGEDHFPMTTDRLLEAEKSDAVAYLLDLQG